MRVWPQSRAEAQGVGAQPPVTKGMGVYKKHSKLQTERGNRAERGVRRVREGWEASED